MKNSIDASVEFYFKGERYTPSATIDLDQFMEGLVKDHGEPPPLYLVLATKNGIDTYSYQYEIMLEEEIQFSNPTGLAVEHLNDGAFNMEGFKKAWREQSVLKHLQPIAKQYLAMDDLAQSPGLKAALLAAYELGKDSTD